MKDKKNEIQDLCQCNHCAKEIPISAAMTHEGLEYVLHFCGVVCYNEWQVKNVDKNKS